MAKATEVVEEKIISKNEAVDAFRAYNEVLEKENQLDARTETRRKEELADYADVINEITEITKGIAEEHAAELKELDEEKKIAALTVQQYLTQISSESTEFAGLGKAVFVEKGRTYSINEDKDMVEVLELFKSKYPDSYEGYFTEYPKFAFKKMDGLISLGLGSKEEFKKMGIDYSSEREFQLKPIKK
ncbi:hypothetical protein WAF17_20970 [Bernardetia sp. ABR2-2B]|uniref:hypothetical protein n=1 Tax=Bernardetia sp. ABR2-2B TaxID=3127472 RepID=UPI0030D55392